MLTRMISALRSYSMSPIVLRILEQLS
jgi:hypothetical protein